MLGYLSTLATLVASLALVSAPPASAIVQGRDADPDAWRSALLFSTSAGICSATVVGRRAILTAAFCVGPAAPGSEEIESQAQVSGVAYRIKCRVHPDYPRLVSADFALCATDRDLVGVSIERVNTEAGLLTPTSAIVLVGYGCRFPGGLDRAFGRLSEGEARLRSQPTRDNLYTEVTGAAVCFGDGGGGAFVVLDKQTGQRTLIGVNSRGDIRERSFLATTGTESFRSWATAWTARSGSPVCGISADSNACAIAGNTGSMTSLIESMTADRPTPPMAVPTGWSFTSAREQPVATSQPVAAAGAAGLIAEAAGRLTKVSARKGETVEALVQRACGRPESDAYFGQLEAFYSKSGLDLRRQTRFEDEREVPLLACSASRRVVEVTVADKDSAWRYYVRVLRDHSNAGWKGFEPPAGAPRRGEKSPYFLEALKALNKDVDFGRLALGARVLLPVTPADVEEVRSVVATAPRSTEAVFAVPQSADAKCGPPGQTTDYPYDVAAVLDVLTANRFRDLSKTRQPINVLVADSGIYGARTGVFRDSVLIRGGPSWDAYVEEVRPLYAGPEPVHGTQVASLVLGGPLFARLHAVAEPPRIRLMIKRIYARYEQGAEKWFGLVDQAFDKVNQAIERHGIFVVNLSLKSRSEILAVKSKLGGDSPVLFVVAAGNLDGQLGSGNRVFPAQQSAENLITVAAIGHDRRLAPFSNFGPDWVEIAAPGCAVPALSYDAQRESWHGVELNGTSIAAPLVSFAAAMVRSEKVDGATPVAVKRRLLASADLVPELAGQIADGRVLNIVKALAIHQDVVQLVGGSGLIMGDIVFLQNSERLADDHAIDFVCGVQTLSVTPKQIMKLVPSFGSGNARVTKLYYRVEDRMLLKDCAAPSGLTVLVSDHVRGREEAYELSQVADIVRRDLD